MRKLFRAAATIVCACAPALAAQSDTYWEIRPVAGVAVPTGSHRGAFEDVAFLGAQTSIRLTADVDLVASFGWQVSRGKYAVADTHADVLVYNFGLERLFRRTPGASGAFVPFAGGGVGGRAFDFRSSALQSTACYAGYANAGIAYERHRSTMRLELRDNVFCFKSPVAPFDRVARNEASVSLGMGVRF